MVRAFMVGMMLAALSAPALAQIDTAPPKTIWDSDLDGTAVHVETGLQCPKAVGDFQRTRFIAYDKNGLDVSCNYKNPGNGDDITVYLTRRNPALQQQVFDGAKQAVVTTTPSAKPRDSVLAAPHSDLKWLLAGFTEHDGAVASDLLLTSLAGWDYEFRATYRPANQATVVAAIADMDALVMRTAGPHLMACAAAASPVRAGQPMHVAKLTASLVVSGAARVALMMPDIEKGTEWCAETGLSIGGQPYLDWRNVAANAAVVERITGGPGTPRAYTLKDPAAGEMMVSNTANPPPDGGFVVLVDGGDALALRDIYAGFPPLLDVARQLAGSHQVMAIIGKTDKKITLYASAVNPGP